MRKISIKNGEYTESLEKLLFAVQRLDEILFFYTQDTYKANVYNTRMLFEEFLDVQEKMKEGILDRKNDEAIVEEIKWSLKKDKEARELIGETMCGEFEKNIGSYSAQEKEKIMRYFLSCLSGLKYFAKIKENLENSMTRKEKSEIERLLKQFVCEAKNCGYNTRHIYRCLNQVFLCESVNANNALTEFLKCFDCRVNKYIVYIEVNNELGSLCVDLGGALRGVNVSIVEKADVLSVIRKSKEENVILKFDYIQALDNYSALDIARNAIKIMGHFYTFYRHNISTVANGGYVEEEGGTVIYVRPEVTGISKSAKVGSREKSFQDASSLFELARTNVVNFYVLSRVTEIHNIAFGMDSASNSLLDLWSVFELLLEKNESNGKSRIFQITEMVEPFLKCAYIEQIVVTFANDLRRWNKSVYEEVVNYVDVAGGEIEKLFAFLALSEYDDLRKDVYKKLDAYPLLRYRIYTLNNNFRKSENIKRLLEEHEKKTTWHIQRIYRARNCIIHDGENIVNIESLVENLHSYIDILCVGVIKILSGKEQEYSITDTIYEMKIREKVFYDLIEKEEPQKANINRYLHW